MKIHLPKELRGVVFTRVLVIEMNDFDIDIFLPAFFFTILAKGKGKARITNDPKDIERYIQQLASHPDMQGFDSSEGYRVLERLVRTSLVITGKAGEGGKKGEQIISLVPYTILTHKTGLPASQRQRRADIFVYQALRDYLGGDNALRDAAKQVFGRGIEIGQEPELGGHYDGETQLDILTRLSIAFIDGFNNTRPQLNREKKLPNAFPTMVNELAKDLLRYLFEFHNHMPTQAFIYNLQAIIDFELFIYTLHVVHAINALVQNPTTLPPAMHDELQPSTLQVYLDFTNGETPRSREMAKSCVRRDVEAYQQFLWSNLLLRQLDAIVSKLQKNSRRKAEIEKVLAADSAGADYLQGLLLLRDDIKINQDIEASARTDEERILNENIDNEAEDEEKDLIEQALNAIADTGESDLERVINLLAEAQRTDATAHFIQWFYGAGGIRKPHGILRGSTRHRQSWSYAPENDLLAPLVQVVAARLSQPGQLRTIKLQEFLDFLKDHYGILIDTPPASFEGAEYAAAARENLRAMLKRLRQMGIFTDLSDDFTVQRLHPPYAGTEQWKVEAY
jgi:hypothetical protein